MICGGCGQEFDPKKGGNCPGHWTYSIEITQDMIWIIERLGELGTLKVGDVVHIPSHGPVG